MSGFLTPSLQLPTLPPFSYPPGTLKAQGAVTAQIAETKADMCMLYFNMDIKPLSSWGLHCQVQLKPVHHIT